MASHASSIQFKEKYVETTTYTICFQTFQALGLNGQKLLGIPVIVQPSQAEKNRTAQMNERLINKTDKGPMRLYVGSLHFNITEEMLRGIFEPFGRIQSISLMLDQVKLIII